MLTNQDKLQIFEDFRIDWQLKKYQTKAEFKGSAKFSSNVGPDEDESMDESMDETEHTRRFVSRATFQNGANFTISTNQAGSVVMQDNKKPHRKPWWKVWVPVPPVEPEPVPELTIEHFFTSVKGSTEQIEIVRERAQGYEIALRNSQISGQQALFETLSKNLAAARAESHLVSMGLPKYLTEEKLVEFVKKCPKGLRLDWITNFIRIIPSRLLDLKIECDNRFVFDNYAVLHFDPAGKSYAETQAEKNAKKDPILFGVMNGRRRLYYVGDWVDVLCDLTLDKVADILGSGGVSEIGEVV